MDPLGGLPWHETHPVTLTPIGLALEWHFKPDDESVLEQEGAVPPSRVAP